MNQSNASHSWILCCVAARVVNIMPNNNDVFVC